MATAYQTPPGDERATELPAADPAGHEAADHPVPASNGHAGGNGQPSGRDRGPDGSGKLGGRKSKAPPRPKTAGPITVNIPAELKDRPQWVVWRYAWRDGRWTKIPYQVRRPWECAETNNPETWASFPEAIDFYARNQRQFDGIGYVFSVDDPFTGIDADGCLGPDGEILDWAKPYVDPLSPTYAEISPSGKGIKFIVRGSLPGSGTRKGGLGPDGTGAIEAYDQCRFFTITGKALDTNRLAIEDRSEQVVLIYDQIKPKGKAKASKPPTDRPDPGPLCLDDQGVIDLCRKAKNEPKFSKLFDQGDVSGYPSHSEADAALCSILAFYTRDAAQIERIVGNSALGSRDKWALRDDYRTMTSSYAIDVTTETYSPPIKVRLHRKSEPADGKAQTYGQAESAGPDWDAIGEEAQREQAERNGQDRPAIEITTERHEVVATAIATLTIDPTLYRRCERLVTVVEDTRTRVKISLKTAVRQQEKSPRIIELSNAVIGLALTRNGEWFQWKKDPEGEFISVPAHPPDWAINAVASYGHWPGVRFLRAVAEAPFIRPDGTVVESPGYDADTETLYIPSGSFLPVPLKPTQADAQAAAQILFDLVAQFPFVDDDHKVVWLAALLSVIGRPAITGACPGIVFDANAAGTGKGLLATIISIIASGRDAATIGYPQDSAEMGKIITAVALAAYPLILLDNVPNGSKFGNDQLDRALTSTVVDGRELGKSRMVGMLDLTAIWLLTGNNVGPTADAFRRWLTCRIESKLERPDRRDDLTILDLPEYVREHRGELVAAALTILRAHAEAGWPAAGPEEKKLAPLGSYTAWDRVVRGAVWFATGRDCCATQDQLNTEDPERRERHALTLGWYDLPGGRTGLTSGEAIEEVQKNPKKHEAMKAIFLDWGHKGEIASPRTIGNRLKAIKGQNIGGFKFATAGEDKRSTKWKVVKVGNESDESDESVPAPTRRFQTPITM